MSNKLRPLFDKLYVYTEGWVNGRKDRKSGIAYAKALGPSPEVREKYACVIRPYWRQFKVRTPRRFWFDLFANPSKAFSPKYIPDDLWFARILPYYSDTILAKAWQDKCIQNITFPDMRRPKTVVKRVAGVFYDDDLAPLTQDQALERCHGAGRVIVKPSLGSGGGRGIEFCDVGSMTCQQVLELFRRHGRNFIIQEKLTQHPALARMNPQSLNTLRIITFLRDGQVHVLSSILRIGGAGSEMDNISQGGFQCNVGPDGQLTGPAMTHFRGKWEYFDVHPDSGIPFGDITVPGYDKVLRAVVSHAARMAHFKIIGWDIAVDPDGEPVLVEFNALPGQNQESDGPTFGDMTDAVLEEVFGRRK